MFLLVQTVDPLLRTAETQTEKLIKTGDCSAYYEFKYTLSGIA